MPTIQYIKGKIKQKNKRKKGYILEQPWTSALWEHLRDNPGNIHRADQCRYNAKDELGNPILKPTGLQSNIQLRCSTNRCAGHLGKRHGWLQGSVQGMNSTTLAAVYPPAFCKAIIKDVKKFIKDKNSYHESYYKCPRCKEGRTALPDVKHSFIPGECRHGKWPEGENPRDIKQAEKERQEKDDVYDIFKREAMKNEKTLKGKLTIHTDFALNNEQTAILKTCLVKGLEESMSFFEECDKAKLNHDFTHWIENPVAMSWLKSVFQDYMMVEGVMATLNSFAKPTPDPVLLVEKAPIRLLIRGNIEHWHIGKMEDLRELSASQWHEPLDLEMDWLVAIFGSDLKEKEAASSSSSSSSRPKAPATKDKDAEDIQDLDTIPVEGEGAIIEAPEIEEEATDQVAVGGLKPLYNFRRIFKKLPVLIQKDDIQTAKRLILGLHERMWHAPYLDIKNVLIRCGVPYEVWKLAADAISTCVICRKYPRAGRRPQAKGTNLSNHFNDLVQMDLFKYQDEWFALIIDEATRYKVAVPCEGRELHQILSTLMKGWIRYFGPMRSNSGHRSRIVFDDSWSW